MDFVFALMAIINKVAVVYYVIVLVWHVAEMVLKNVWVVIIIFLEYLILVYVFVRLGIRRTPTDSVLIANLKRAF